MSSWFTARIFIALNPYKTPMKRRVMHRLADLMGRLDSPFLRQIEELEYELDAWRTDPQTHTDEQIESYLATLRRADFKVI